MPLTQDQCDKIKVDMATLEYKNGEGLIKAIKRRITNSKDFYLIVGLGGTG